MDSFDRLVQFIDRYTHNGTQDLPQILCEGVGIEASGAIYLNQFLDGDWWQLQNYWQAQSDRWIEALIYLLIHVDSDRSRDVLVKIVLVGNDESSFKAIEYVRDFCNELDPEVKSQLDRKLSRIISSRIKRV